MGGAELREVYCNVLIMQQSCCLWLGADPSAATLGALTTALQTRFDPVPASTLLVPGLDGKDSGGSIAEHLARRFAVQTFVACDLPEEFGAEIAKIEAKLVELLEPHFNIKKSS